jgi:hypothetical protein
MAAAAPRNARANARRRAARSRQAADGWSHAPLPPSLRRSITTRSPSILNRTRSSRAAVAPQPMQVRIGAATYAPAPSFEEGDGDLSFSASSSARSLASSSR